MTERLKSPDFRDKYRWPDPDIGWSGPLAGYPPDHPIRRGIPIPLSLIARQYQADPEVTRYQASGHITLSLSQELEAERSETPASVPKVSVPKVAPCSESPGDVPKVEEDVPKLGRPKSGLSKAERQAAYRKRKEERAREGDAD